MSKHHRKRAVHHATPPRPPETPQLHHMACIGDVLDYHTAAIWIVADEYGQPTLATTPMLRLLTGQATRHIAEQILAQRSIDPATIPALQTEAAWERLRAMNYAARGPNLYAITEDGSEAIPFLRLASLGGTWDMGEPIYVPPGVVSSTLDHHPVSLAGFRTARLRDYIDLSVGHTMRDMMLGDEVCETRWVVKGDCVVPEGPDRYDFFLPDIDSPLREDVLDQGIFVSAGGHVYMMGRGIKRLLGGYLFTDLDVLDESSKFALKADAVRDMALAAGETIFAETIDSSAVKGYGTAEDELAIGDRVYVQASREVGSMQFAMFVNAADMESAHAWKVGADRPMMRFQVSTVPWPIGTEAVAYGIRLAERHGISASLLPEDVARFFIRLADRADSDTLGKQMKRAEAQNEAQGRRSDAPLVRVLAERYGRREAVAWQEGSALIYLGPIQGELRERIGELADASPMLEYRPFRSMIFDFGVDVSHHEDFDVVYQQWVRVSDMETWMDRHQRNAPWLNITSEHDANIRDPANLVIECFIHTVFPTDSWVMHAGIVDPEWWGRRKSGIIAVGWSGMMGDASLPKNQQELEAATAILPDGLLATAHLASMPERLYEVRRAPRGPMHERDSPKPWTRTDLPHYRTLDPFTAPRPQRESQGGTHASPRPHQRRAHRVTLFHPRYYQHERMEIVATGAEVAPPTLTEMHYRTSSFVSGRDSEARPHVWTRLGHRWYELRVHELQIGLSIVGMSEEAAAEGYTVDGVFYRVVDRKDRTIS